MDEFIRLYNEYICLHYGKESPVCKGGQGGVDEMGLIQNIREEIQIIKERDPAIHSSMEVFLYPSFKVMMHAQKAPPNGRRFRFAVSQVR